MQTSVRVSHFHREHGCVTQYPPFCLIFQFDHDMWLRRHNVPIKNMDSVKGYVHEWIQTIRLDIK